MFSGDSSRERGINVWGDAVFAGHDSVTAYVHSQKLGLCAQSEVIQISSTDGMGFMKPHTIDEWWLPGREDLLSSGIWPLRGFSSQSNREITKLTLCLFGFF